MHQRSRQCHLHGEFYWQSKRHKFPEQTISDNHNLCGRPEIAVPDLSRPHLSDPRARYGERWRPRPGGRRGLSKTWAIGQAVVEELKPDARAVQLRERLEQFRAEYPLPASTELGADKAFFDQMLAER